MRRAEAGTTLVDSLISLALLASVLGGVAMFLRSAFRESSATTARALLARRAGAVVERISDELLMAQLTSLSPADAPLGATALDFRVPASVSAAGVAWANVARIEWQADPADPADGADNDADGAIDEGRVVLRRDFGLGSERTIVLATGVAALLEGEAANALDDNGNGLEDEGGLCFERTADGRVLVRVTLVAQGNGGLLMHTAAATVSPRN